MLEQTGILIGDRIDIKTAKVEKKAPKTSDTFRAPASEEKFDLNGELWEPPTTKVEIKLEAGAANAVLTTPSPAVTPPATVNSAEGSAPIVVSTEPAITSTPAPMPTPASAPSTLINNSQSAEPTVIKDAKAEVPSEIRQDAMISPAIAPEVGATVE